jgi:hypothetical protein
MARGKIESPTQTGLIVAEFRVEERNYEHTVEQIRRVGGQIIKSTLPWEQTKRAQEALEADIKILPPEVISERMFRAEAPRNLTKGWVTQYWNLGMHLSSRRMAEEEKQEFQEAGIINLELVLGEMRSIEAGDEQHLWGFGPVSWNIYTKLINERLIQDYGLPLILEWDPAIHPKLEREKSKRDAAARLETKYREIEAAHNLSESQGSLF